MRHFATPSFWQSYEKLPEQVRRLADKNFALLKANSQHPSLHFKRVGRLWSVRVGLRYRALGVNADSEDIVWFWIGSHADYDALISSIS
jgi:mRNA-degrading endonuclease RelE of RelBE toxin-antitoxin system